MKLTITFACICIASLTFSQSQWKIDELDVISQYGLDTNDHRGLVLVQDVNALSTAKEVLTNFLNATTKMDLIEIKTPFIPEFKSYFNRPLDIHEVIELYLKLTK